MHLPHNLLFLYYIQEIKTIIIPNFKIKKLRHEMVKYLTQDLTVLKWGNLESSQEVSLQTPHSTTNSILPHRFLANVYSTDLTII